MLKSLNGCRFVGGLFDVDPAAASAEATDDVLIPLAAVSEALTVILMGMLMMVIYVDVDWKIGLMGLLRANAENFGVTDQVFQSLPHFHPSLIHKRQGP